METREVTESTNRNRSLYMSEEESGTNAVEVLEDEYLNEDESEYDDTLYDDYWDDEELDYDDTLYNYDDDYETNIVTTTGTTYQPRNTVYETPISAKTQQMFWSFAGLLFLVILGTRCIEKGDKRSKILAMIGLGTGAVGFVLQMLLIWQVFSLTEPTGSFSTGISMMGKITLSIMITAVAMMACAVIMRINENEKIVKVTKWIAMGCGLGFWVIELMAIIQNDYNVAGKLVSAGTALLSCCLICWVVAWVLSRFSSKETPTKIEQVDSAQIEPIQTEPGQVEMANQQVPQGENSGMPTDPFGNN